MFLPYKCDIIGKKLQENNGNQTEIKETLYEGISCMFWSKGNIGLSDSITGQSTATRSYKCMLESNIVVDTGYLIDIEGEGLFKIDVSTMKHLSRGNHHRLLILSKTNA